MKKKWMSISLLVISIVLIIIYFEITHFSPYNTGIPFFLDRVLEFIFPAGVCLIIRHRLKTRE